MCLARHHVDSTDPYKTDSEGFDLIRVLISMGISKNV